MYSFVSPTSSHLPMDLGEGGSSAQSADEATEALRGEDPRRNPSSGTSAP